MNHSRIFAVLIALLFTIPGFSQSLTFCDKVDGTGKAVNANSAFTIAKNGGPVTLLFTLPAGSRVATVNFDLYKIDNGKEVFQSTMKQPVNAAQGWVSKQITLYNEGKYRVYVFDDQDKQLAKGELTIKK
jgi:hypothetical protein